MARLMLVNGPPASGRSELARRHVDDLESDLESGAVGVVGDDRIRVRLLPLLHDD